MPGSKQVDLTDSQIYALAMLSEQRGVNLIQLCDLIGDMNSDGLEFLRRLGDPRHEPLTKFLAGAKPETLTFLAEARPEEIDNLKDGLRLVVAIQLIGKISRWAVVTFFGMFVGMALIWDKVGVWLKAR